MATKAIASAAVNQLEIIECPIAKLAEEDLAAIFKHLQPYQRLIVSGVCLKWRDVSQAPWRDITCLDLSQVPTENIHAVIKKCPNLISVSALRQCLGDLGRFASRLNNITSLKCVECTFTTNQNVNHPLYISIGPDFGIEVHGSVRSTSWNELIWHQSRTAVLVSGMPVRENPMPFGNPATIRRLQISSLRLPNGFSDEVTDALRQLPLLESCILADVRYSSDDYYCFGRFSFNRQVLSSLATSANLRELYLHSAYDDRLARLVFALPVLKILYLNIAGCETSLDSLMTQHASLCVLVITASSVRGLSCRLWDIHKEILIPPRTLFPNGFNAHPVPQLHLFLGKYAAGKLRFQPSPNDALKIYPIVAPLPDFLEKEEIKPFFEGSWIASRIKEGAKTGVNLDDYSFEGNAESILYI